METKDPTGRIARWIMFLQQFDFQIKYRKGIDNTAADALSRLPISNKVLTVKNIIPLPQFRDLNPAIPDDLLDLLIYYMRSCNLPPNIGEKEKNLIIEAAPQFKLGEDNNLYIIRKGSKNYIE